MTNIKVLLDVDLMNKMKRFFYLYLNDYEGSLDLDEIDNYISDNQSLHKIVDYYGIINNWSVISALISNEDKDDEDIEETLDPKKELEQKKKQEKISIFEQNLKDYKVETKDIKTDLKKGLLIIKNEVFGKIELPLLSIYSLIEQDCPEESTLTNSFGETILRLIHGSFINAALADIQIFGSQEDLDDNSLFNPTSKGGIFIRKNGTIDVGDIQRTRYLTIDISALVKEMYLKGLTSDATKYLNDLNIKKI